MTIARMPALGTPLTPSERRILVWTAAGMTAPEIAREHHYSVHTVSSHLQRIYAKLGAHNAAHAVLIGCREGLLAECRPPRAWISINNRRETSDVLYLSEDSAKRAATNGFLDDGVSHAPFEWRPVLGGLLEEQQLFHDGKPTNWRVAVQIWADAHHLERAA